MTIQATRIMKHTTRSMVGNCGDSGIAGLVQRKRIVVAFLHVLFTLCNGSLKRFLKCAYRHKVFLCLESKKFVSQAKHMISVIFTVEFS